MNELILKSASELATLISKKDVSSREVVEAHLNRIQEVNPEINAITIVLEDSAMSMLPRTLDSDSKRSPSRVMRFYISSRTPM